MDIKSALDSCLTENESLNPISQLSILGNQRLHPLNSTAHRTVRVQSKLFADLFQTVPAQPPGQVNRYISAVSWRSSTNPLDSRLSAKIGSPGLSLKAVRSSPLPIRESKFPF